MIQYVDLEAVRTAPGVRLVVSGIVPSPWSEAAKSLFRVAKIPVLAARPPRGDNSHTSWTLSHNVPVVLHDQEPPRTGWSQIVALAARLAPTTALLPHDLDARVTTMGLLHEVAGEDGVGWNARLMMIHASLSTDGARGFPLPVAKYLAPKYGYAPERIETARAQVIATLTSLAARLGDASYFGGTQPDALDVYVATFLTPLTDITPTDCPAMSSTMRNAFAVAKDELAQHVPASLFELRRRMFDTHLAYPIEL